MNADFGLIDNCREETFSVDNTTGDAVAIIGEALARRHGAVIIYCNGTSVSVVKGNEPSPWRTPKTVHLGGLRKYAAIHAVAKAL